MLTRKLSLAAAGLLFAATAAPAFAQDFGTEEEARAMLERVVQAVQEDEQAALKMFTEGTEGFKDRDLYPFCGNEEGEFTAHPSLVGESLRDLEDKAGEPLGGRIYDAAAEGEVGEVEYMWPRPGEEEPIQKVALVTKIGDQTCAVGYYVDS